jgi:hypothetical protein
VEKALVCKYCLLLIISTHNKDNVRVIPDENNFQKMVECVQICERPQFELLCGSLNSQFQNNPG